jgi:hypothetical protein
MMHKKQDERNILKIFEETLRGKDKDIVTPEDKKSLYTFVLV